MQPAKSTEVSFPKGWKGKRGVPKSNRIINYGIPILQFSNQPKMIIWVLASLIFDSIWPIKNKM
jgi:hypothetical protein